jgi:hypothetical protein
MSLFFLGLPPTCISIRRPNYTPATFSQTEVATSGPFDLVGGFD